MAQSVTYPLPTLACTVDSTGISAPAYDQILSSLQASFRAIYGSDLYLDPDGQDMQMLAVFALAVHDSNQAAIAVYNEFSPATAVGAGLSSVVKINGLRRLVPTNSTVDVVLVGQAGTVITNGQVGDIFGTAWALPASVIIDPISGQVAVTAVCTIEGAIQAAPGTVNTILTPTRGWQTVTNPLAAVIGAPVETDAALRQRQSLSTALPALSVLDGINAAVAALTGVERLQTYENDTDAPDIDGLPEHSIAVVVEGGDVTEICNTIALKKTPGCFTYGDTAQIVLDQQGMPNTIAFFPLRLITILVEITLRPLPGYTSTVGNNIATSEAANISALPIGYDVYLSKAYAFSELPVSQGGLTYEVTQIRLRRQGTFIWDAARPHGWNEGFWDGPFRAADVTILFNEAAICDVSNITMIIQAGALLAPPPPPPPPPAAPGAYVENTGPSITLSDGVAVNLASISLGPGNWMVNGSASFSTGAALIYNITAGAGSSSATLPLAPYYTQFSPGGALSGNQSLAIPGQRFSLAVTTTIYLVARVGFGPGSTVTAMGHIYANQV